MVSRCSSAYYPSRGNTPSPTATIRDDVADNEMEENTVSNVIGSLLEDPIFSDVKIIVGEDAEEFNLHRNILSARSSFFKAALSKNYAEGANQEILLPEVKPLAFRMCLNWIYTDTLPLDGNMDMFPDIFQAADYLQLAKVRILLVEWIDTRFSIGEDLPLALQEPLTFLIKMAAVLPPSEATLLKNWVGILIRTRRFPVEELETLSKLKENDGSCAFQTLLVMTCLSFNDTLDNFGLFI
ncbi:hypothetical protein ABW19_dt0207765 [Dactylella cylindrospora]|nr:hypothetical protein ABW19_dt0207765 [Dactylella cylindrospora]